MVATAPQPEGINPEAPLNDPAILEVADQALAEFEATVRAETAPARAHAEDLFKGLEN